MLYFSIYTLVTDPTTTFYNFYTHTKFVHDYNRTQSAIKILVTTALATRLLVHH